MQDKPKKKEKDTQPDVQKLLDRYVHAEGGAELILDIDTPMGAIADAVYSPEFNEIVIKMLSSPEEMPYNRHLHFFIKDNLEQADKNRVVFRSTNLHIYMIRPIETDKAQADFAAHELPVEEKKELRKQLQESLKY